MCLQLVWLLGVSAFWELCSRGYRSKGGELMQHMVIGVMSRAVDRGVRGDDSAADSGLVSWEGGITADPERNEGDSCKKTWGKEPGMDVGVQWEKSMKLRGQVSRHHYQQRIWIAACVSCFLMWVLTVLPSSSSSFLWLPWMLHLPDCSFSLFKLIHFKLWDAENKIQDIMKARQALYHWALSQPTFQTFSKVSESNK